MNFILPPFIINTYRCGSASVAEEILRVASRRLPAKQTGNEQRNPAADFSTGRSTAYNGGWPISALRADRFESPLQVICGTAGAGPVISEAITDCGATVAMEPSPWPVAVMVPLAKMSTLAEFVAAARYGVHRRHRHRAVNAADDY